MLNFKNKNRFGQQENSLFLFSDLSIRHEAARENGADNVSRPAAESRFSEFSFYQIKPRAHCTRVNDSCRSEISIKKYKSSALYAIEIIPR